MSNGRSVSVFLALTLMANAFCAPSNPLRRRRGFDDNQIDFKESTIKPNTATEQKKDDVTIGSSTISSNIEHKSDEDDDDFDEQFNSPPSTGGGGSNIFTLLNLANALFPASSGTTSKIRDKIRNFLTQNRVQFAHRRQDVADNEIKIEYATALKAPTAEPVPTFQRQENSESDSETSESISESEEDKAEESVEKENNKNISGDTNTRQESASNESNNDSDYDEPKGNGEGGGILGLLSGGGSDLGTLLAVVGGVVVNLSGGDVDINDAIEAAISLFVGLLSNGEINPGEIIASYLQTALDTITGGGAQNNGQFFGKFVSKLIKGISAAGTKEELEGNPMPMSDSGGFLFSLVMGLLGDMSKSSFDGSSKPWR